MVDSRSYRGGLRAAAQCLFVHSATDGGPPPTPEQADDLMMTTSEAWGVPLPSPPDRVCHRCDHVPQSPEQTHCARDGLHLVERHEHDDWPRDMYLGTTVGGRYPIIGVLGHGGMGAVYRSVQPHVEREVAIKLVLPVEKAARDTVARRFLREAKAVAGLSHPAVVTLFDFGVEDDGTAFMVLELVRGATLTRAMRRGDVGAGRLVAILVEVLGALDAAHRQGLVHRDLKPDNVMVLDEASGGHTVKVLDFGLAKISGLSGGGKLTRTNMVFGTPPYMAPEQATASAVDARTDLYAVGVILYQGLAGRLPFDGDDPMQILMGHVNDPPPPLPAHVAEPLVAVVMQALAKAPEERFPDARAMAAALEDALTTAGIRALTPEERDTTPEGAVEGPIPQPAEEDEVRPIATAGAPTLDSPAEIVPTEVTPQPAEPTIQGAAPEADSTSLPAAPRELPRARARTSPPVATVDAKSVRSIQTLSDAAGEVSEPILESTNATVDSIELDRYVRSPRRPILVIGGAAAAAVVLTMLAIQLGSDDGALEPLKAASKLLVTEVAAPAAMPKSAPAPVVALPGAPAPAPPATVVHIVSEPPGAKVRLGDQVLGKTPLDHRPAGAAGTQVDYRLEGEGLVGESVSVKLDGGQHTLSAQLKRRPATPRPTARRAAASRPRPRRPTLTRAERPEERRTAPAKPPPPDFDSLPVTLE